MVCWVEVDLDAIAHNLRQIKKIIGPEVKLMGVVKANAYGHGLVQTARTIWAAGAESLAVADLEEALQLRGGGIRCPILVLGFVPYIDIPQLVESDISPTIYDLPTARAISREAERQEKKVSSHIKIDTGMHRLGVLATSESSRQTSASPKVVEFISQITRLPGMEISALYSHFADAKDSAYTRRQMILFQDVLFQLQKAQIPTPPVHLANSYATLKIPAARLDMVRVGLALYGLSRDLPESRPALTFKAKVAQVKELPAGASVGYLRTFVTKRPTKMAVITVGYAHGFARYLSNIGEVLISGKRCKVIGKITMNQAVVEVTGLQVFQADEVVLIGKQEKEEITVDEIAKKMDTISYEVVSRIPSSVPRVYK